MLEVILMASTSNHSARNQALLGVTAMFAALLGVLSFSGLVSAAIGSMSDTTEHYDLIAFAVIIVILVIVLAVAYLGHKGKDQ